MAAISILFLTLALAVSSCTEIVSDLSGSEPTPLPPGVEYRSRTYPGSEVRPDGSRVLYAAEVQRNGTLPGGQHLELDGGGQGPQTLDPALLRDASSSFLARQIFRGLIRLDSDLKPHPDLARRVEISSDSREYTFYLRADAIFHNGDPIDARAVADSLNRACDPGLADGDGFSLPAATYLIDIQGARERLAGDAEHLSGVEVLDAHSLRMTLHRPSPTFLSKLAGSPALIVDTSRSQSAEWWLGANGSGPFVIESYDPASALDLVGFDQFWDGPPLLESVRVRYGTSAVQPLNLYEAGEIDVAQAPQFALDRVTSDTNYLHNQVVVQPQLSTTFIVLNPNMPPYDDPALRGALSHLLDREKIVNVTLQGRARLAEGLVPNGMLGRDWPAQLPERDLAEARQALNAAIPLSRTPQIYEPGGTIAVILKQVAKQDLGLEINVISQQWPQFSDDLASQDLPAFVLTWIADYAEPENFLEALFHTDSPDNYAGYSNPEVDRLLDRAATASDPDERIDLYLKAQQRIIDDGVLIPLYHDVDYTLVKPYVRNLVVTEAGILTLDSVWIEN